MAALSALWSGGRWSGPGGRFSKAGKALGGDWFRTGESAPGSDEALQRFKDIFGSSFGEAEVDPRLMAQAQQAALGQLAADFSGQRAGLANQLSQMGGGGGLAGLATSAQQQAETTQRSGAIADIVSQITGQRQQQVFQERDLVRQYLDAVQQQIGAGRQENLGATLALAQIIASIVGGVAGSAGGPAGAVAGSAAGSQLVRPFGTPNYGALLGGNRPGTMSLADFLRQIGYQGPQQQTYQGYGPS